MMEVQKYLREHGLERLIEEFHIVCTMYPDRVVLNYNQIESPRFVTLVDECRALILRKDTWEVMARSFDRFYNLGESVEPKMGLDMQRIANPGIKRTPTENDTFYRSFNITNSTILEKLDGSLMSFYWDGAEWCVSTRKMAFAEGQTNLGRTFKEVFFDAAGKRLDFIKREAKDMTLVFELTGPENRVVTPYLKNSITLIGGRSNREEENYRELSGTELDNIAFGTGIARPKEYKVNSYQELLDLVNSFPTMDEGVVLLIENENGSHRRIKCKNPAYLAIAHMRDNGNISPRRVLALVMQNDHHEYLRYFECDKPYFDFVEAEYAVIKNRIDTIYKEHMAIKDQKEFALTIMPKVVYSFEGGIIFSLRKKGGTIEDGLVKIGAEKIAKMMNLKKMFVDKFHVTIEEEG
jgi:hypothetical protein